MSISSKEIFHFLGPIWSDHFSPRDRYEHELNETASAADAIFQQVIKVESEEEFQLWKTSSILIDKYQSQIEDHVARRVQVFFMQAVACFQTQLHFEIGPVLDQGESGSKLYLEKEDGYYVLTARHAAHSSTIPSLLAFSSEISEKRFVYLYGSDCYRVCNATLELPHAVNRADDLIDGKNTANVGLRFDSIQLINECGKGILDPITATSHFVEKALSRVQLRQLETQDLKVRVALSYYEKKLLEISLAIKGNPDYFAPILGIRMPRGCSDNLQRSFYSIRYRAIFMHHKLQSAILSKIDCVRQKIFAAIKAGKKRYYHLEEAFRYTLIEEVKAPLEKERILKLFNLPLYPYHPIPREDVDRIESEKKMANRADQADRLRAIRLIESKERMLEESELIQKETSEILDMIKTAQEEEVKERKTILKLIREAKKWRQKDVARALKKVANDSPSSRTTVSRMERGEKPIDNQMAEKLAAVLNVDKTLFLPSFFWSV